MRNGWKWLYYRHPKFPEGETKPTAAFLEKLSKKSRCDPKIAALNHRDFVNVVLEALLEEGHCFVPGLGYIYICGPAPIKSELGYRCKVKLKPSPRINTEINKGIAEMIRRGQISPSPKTTTG